MAVVGDLEPDAPLGQPLPQLVELDVDDAPRSASVERAEPDDLVDAVDELGLEERHRVARQVGRHDQHGVGEVDRAALAVGEAAVVEQLQQHVEHVGVGLLDLVEQHHRVRPAAHRLGELAALVVADVAGRRADEAATRSASPCTRDMSMRTIARSSSNRKSASARASSVLPTPVGPRNRNEPIGRLRVGQAGPAAADGVGHRGDGLVLADDPLVQHAPRGGRACCISPSMSRLTRGRRSTWTTTSATSSSSTSSFSICCSACSSSRCVGGVVDPPLELGDAAVADLGGLLEVGLPLELRRAAPRAPP